MLRSLKNFFFRMFGASDATVSSKRVVGFCAFLLIAEIVQAVIWFNKPTPSELLYVLSSILCICFGMNTFLTSKSISAKTDVASDIVKQEPNAGSADDAKEILNSNKP